MCGECKYHSQIAHFGAASPHHFQSPTKAVLFRRGKKIRTLSYPTPTVARNITHKGIHDGLTGRDVPFRAGGRGLLYRGGENSTPFLGRGEVVLDQELSRPCSHLLTVAEPNPTAIATAAVWHKSRRMPRIPTTEMERKSKTRDEPLT